METEVPNDEEVQDIQETTKSKTKPFVPKYESARYDKDTGKYSRNHWIPNISTNITMRKTPWCHVCIVVKW